MYSETTADISVHVEPEFLSEQSNAEENFFLYAYKITIENNSHRSCQLVKRHWIIRDGIGREEHVEGDGVIGKQPVIGPGERFSYTSGCPLSTPTGNMRGKYTMKTAEKQMSIKVPLFFLRPGSPASDGH
mgnify:CR=1 FL=1